MRPIEESPRPQVNCGHGTVAHAWYGVYTWVLGLLIREGSGPRRYQQLCDFSAANYAIEDPMCNFSFIRSGSTLHSTTRG